MLVTGHSRGVCKKRLTICFCFIDTTGSEQSADEEDKENRTVGEAKSEQRQGNKTMNHPNQAF